ncbi:MAG: CDP-diacylglycerol--serine O-phosphatidyltransferase [Enterobacterales bacterium]|nr:CDP-diacylglycerol--serine O-phosphatidyltransferase [Enterobacterales bacterium]
MVKQNILGIKQLKSAIRRLKIKLRRSEYFIKNPLDASENRGIFLTPLLGFGGRKNRLNQTIYELIKQTKKELVIFTPYFNFPAKVNKAVRQQLKQGKKVTILVGDKTANDFYIAEDQPFNKIGILPYIYETSLRRFVQKHQKFIDQDLLSINLWLDPGNSFHLKGISSDQSNYLITGHNINPRAWRLDIENGVLIQDPQQQLADKFNQELGNILSHCSQVKHFEEIETIEQYRPEASKLLKSVKRAKLDSILNRLL